MSKPSRSQLPPTEICGYRIVKVLSPDRCFLAISSASAGRKVVLKQLEQDCLLRGQLHPSIKERLARVRELAHLSIANLYSVEKENEDAYLVWEFIDGETFEKWADAPGRTNREVLVIAREMVLAMEALHAQGIVHGEIHGRNVLIDPHRNVRLTHVSPLLFSDAAEDASAVIALLEYTLGRRGEENSPLGDLLRAARRSKPPMPLRELRSKLIALIESRELDAPQRPHEEDHSTRRRALRSAAIVAIIGVGIAAGVWGYNWYSGDRAPAPPQASAEALRDREATRLPATVPATAPTTTPAVKAAP